MWLLAVAVPAQGFAAASMFNCGPGHHGAAQMHSHDDESGGARTAHEHDGAAPLHSHAGELAVSAADGGHGAEAPAAQKIAKGSCSACASCCTGVALPASVVTFDATPVHEFVVPLAPSSIPAFLTDGPERPPRSILV